MKTKPKKLTEESPYRFLIPIRSTEKEGLWEEHGVGWQREVTSSVFVFGFLARESITYEVLTEWEWQSGGWRKRIVLREPNPNTLIPMEAFKKMASLCDLDRSERIR